MNELKIDQVRISSLKPAEYNPRKWDKKAIDDLTKSIKEFGLVDPIIVNSHIDRQNIIIGGHFRLKIAKDLGYIDVPVVYIEIADINKEKELNIRLNKNTGEFDFDLLKNFDKDFLENVGFDIETMDDIFPVSFSEKDDIVPEVKEATSKIGNIYQLGRHKIMCGDCTIKDNVERLMDGKKADLVFTDPPYAVNYGHDQKELQEKSGGKFSKTRAKTMIQGDNMTAEECSEKLWRPAFHNLYEAADDSCSFYMTMCQGGDQMMMMMMMMSENWQIKHELIWVKNCPVFSMGRLDYDYQHEPILFGWKKKHNFYGKGQFLKSIWQIPKPSKSDLHPTMKPIELIVNALMNSSIKDNIVIDTFLGSGSTLIACEKTDRVCYGMELEPLYIDVIIKRWEDFTGKKAVKLNN